MNSSTVSAELGIQLVVAEEDAVVPLTATLDYSATDPYAVQLSFHVGLDEPVQWTFGRDLLCEGIEGPSGLGDVRIWPSADPATDFRDEVMNIEISSPHGHARFEAPVCDVAEFLCRTYVAVPEGDESKHIDMDDELTEILREAL
jgi:hypothetical protein